MLWYMLKSIGDAGETNKKETGPIPLAHMHNQVKQSVCFCMLAMQCVNCNAEFWTVWFKKYDLMTYIKQEIK